MGIAQFALPYFAIFGIAALAWWGKKWGLKPPHETVFSGKKLTDLGNFGIALLAMCDTKNVDFEIQIGDFNRNLRQFWLVFRAILSIIANFVNISVENSSVEKYAIVRICTLAGG